MSLGALEASFRDSLTRYHHALSDPGGRLVSAIQNDLIGELLTAASRFALQMPSRPHRLPPHPDTFYVAELVRRLADMQDGPSTDLVAARQREALGEAYGKRAVLAEADEAESENAA